MSLLVDAAKPPMAPILLDDGPSPASVKAGPDFVPAAVVLSPDTPHGLDHLARSGDAAFLAELIAHGSAGTPFCLGLFGPAGSGKSAFLSSLEAAVARLAGAAEEAGLATPFLARIATVRVAPEHGVPPATALLRQGAAALARTHPRLVAEADQAGLDPRAAARDAGERLNDARQRLDAERRTLDDLTGRQARLKESVLFDNAGSQVDAYTRANRARIERSLRRFGYDGDMAAVYKEHVRDASEQAGALGHGPSVLRAFWGYRGQTRLIVIALLFFALAWAVGLLIGNEASLVDSVRNGAPSMAGAANWADAHAGWLQPLGQVLVIAGLVALAMNIVRAVRFLQPVMKGRALLAGDVEARRRDLDGMLAHQTRRVDMLSREVETASQHAAAMEGRLGQAPDAAWATPGAEHAATPDGRALQRAGAFFAAAGAAIAAGSRDRLPSSAGAAPSRLVVMIDGLEAVPPSEAAAFVETAHALLGRPGFVTVLAADVAHLSGGLAEADPALATARLSRLVQVPFALGGDAEGWPEAKRYAQALLSAGPDSVPAPDAPDASHSGLDRPWLPGESAVVAALAASAGATPRAVKRFVNLYRVARADPRMAGASAQDLAALALGLAVQAGGMPLAMQGPDDQPLDPLREARTAVESVLGKPLSKANETRGFAAARLYSTGAAILA